MPYCRDIEKIAKLGIKDDSCRTLILVDKGGSQDCAYGKFVHRYDASSQGPINQLFSSTLNILLKSSATDIHSKDTLPIVSFIGIYPVTIITRLSEYDCRITAYTGGQSIHDMMGLG